jgi:hypothetical protein
MQSQEDKTALVIPTEILSDTTLTQAQKIFLCLVFQNENSTKKFGSDNISFKVFELSKLMGITRQGVHKIINSLEDKKILKEIKDTSKFGVGVNKVYTFKKGLLVTFIAFTNVKPLKVTYKRHKDLKPKKDTIKKDTYRSYEVTTISINNGLFSKNVETKGVSNKSPNAFLEKIMKLPGMVKHRIGTQAYRDASRSLRLLSQGQFFFKGDTPVARVKESWLIENNISPIDLRRAWTDRDIFYTFLEISKMLSPGYWPKKKETVPHDVFRLIYNPMSGVSHFLKLFSNGALPLETKFDVSSVMMKSTREDQMDVFAYNKLQELVQECRSDGINMYKLTQQEAAHLKKVAAKMMYLWDTQLHTVGADYTHPSDFVRDYCQWALDQHAGRLEKVWQLGPDTRDWTGFFRDRGLDSCIRDAKMLN